MRILAFAVGARCLVVASGSAKRLATGERVEEARPSAPRDEEATNARLFMIRSEGSGGSSAT
jgi:hypothetical protein